MKDAMGVHKGLFYKQKACPCDSRIHPNPTRNNVFYILCLQFFICHQKEWLMKATQLIEQASCNYYEHDSSRNITNHPLP